jgi:hypothetical protein
MMMKNTISLWRILQDAYELGGLARNLTKVWVEGSNPSVSATHHATASD